MGIQVDASDTKQMFKELAGMPEQAMKEVYPYLKAETPIRTGNARRKTRLSGNTIKSNYGYAGALDDGLSRQAPDGFTAPSIDELGDIITDLVEDINNG
jgi:hypothetical protein